MALLLLALALAPSALAAGRQFAAPEGHVRSSSEQCPAAGGGPGSRAHRRNFDHVDKEGGRSSIDYDAVLASTGVLSMADLLGRSELVCDGDRLLFASAALAQDVAVETIVVVGAGWGCTEGAEGALAQKREGFGESLYRRVVAVDESADGATTALVTVPATFSECFEHLRLSYRYTPPAGRRRNVIDESLPVSWNYNAETGAALESIPLVAGSHSAGGTDGLVGGAYDATASYSVDCTDCWVRADFGVVVDLDIDWFQIKRLYAEGSMDIGASVEIEAMMHGRFTYALQLFELDLALLGFRIICVDFGLSPIFRVNVDFDAELQASVHVGGHFERDVRFCTEYRQQWGEFRQICAPDETQIEPSANIGVSAVASGDVRITFHPELAFNIDPAKEFEIRFRLSPYLGILVDLLTSIELVPGESPQECDFVYQLYWGLDAEVEISEVVLGWPCTQGIIGWFGRFLDPIIPEMVLGKLIGLPQGVPITVVDPRYFDCPWCSSCIEFVQTDELPVAALNGTLPAPLANKWAPGEWGECASFATCGAGTTTRPIECRSVATGELVDASECTQTPPPATQACTVPCDTTNDHCAAMSGECGACLADPGCGWCIDSAECMAVDAGAAVCPGGVDEGGWSLSRCERPLVVDISAPAAGVEVVAGEELTISWTSDPAVPVLIRYRVAPDQPWLFDDSVLFAEGAVADGSVSGVLAPAFQAGSYELGVLAGETGALIPITVVPGTSADGGDTAHKSWTQWSVCSAECGGGVAVRQMRCTGCDPDAADESALPLEQACNVDACPVFAISVPAPFPTNAGPVQITWFGGSADATETISIEYRRPGGAWELIIDALDAAQVQYDWAASAEALQNTLVQIRVSTPTASGTSPVFYPFFVSIDAIYPPSAIAVDGEAPADDNDDDDDAAVGAAAGAGPSLLAAAAAVLLLL